MTLGQTIVGNNLYKLTKDWNYAIDPRVRAYLERLSRAWVNGIPRGSTVHVFLDNPSPDGIWMTVEKPLLIKRGVRIIEHIITE